MHTRFIKFIFWDVPACLFTSRVSECWLSGRDIFMWMPLPGKLSHIRVWSTPGSQSSSMLISQALIEHVGYFHISQALRPPSVALSSGKDFRLLSSLLQGRDAISTLKTHTQGCFKWTSNILCGLFTSHRRAAYWNWFCCSSVKAIAALNRNKCT